MSRIGRAPINIPTGVNIGLRERAVTVKGPKGELSLTLGEPIEVQIDGSVVTVMRPDDAQRNRQLHGLTRTLIANMVGGVTNGFSRALEIQGVGLPRADARRQAQLCSSGFSHPVVVEPPAGLTIAVEGTNKITVSGADKQAVGQLAAQIRGIRPARTIQRQGHPARRRTRAAQAGQSRQDRR